MPLPTKSLSRLLRLAFAAAGCTVLTSSFPFLAVAAATNNAVLPDAPVVQTPVAATLASPMVLLIDAPNAEGTRKVEVVPALSRSELAAACETGKLRGKPCKVHWLKILGESFEFLSLQHLGNMGTDNEIWHDLTDGQSFWEPMPIAFRAIAGISGPTIRRSLFMTSDIP